MSGGHSKLKHKLGSVLLRFGGLSALAAVVIVSLQCFGWLHDGYWTPHFLGEIWFLVGLPYPQISWVGVQRIVLWILNLPLSLSLMMVAIFLCLVAERLDSR